MNYPKERCDGCPFGHANSLPFDYRKEENEELRAALARKDQAWGLKLQEAHARHQEELKKERKKRSEEEHKRNAEIADLKKQLSVFKDADNHKNRPDSFAGDDVKPAKKPGEKLKKRKGHKKGGRKKEKKLPKESTTKSTAPPQCCNTAMQLERKLKPRVSEKVEVIVKAVVRELIKERGVYQCKSCGAEKIAEAEADIDPLPGKYTLKTIIRELTDHIAHQIPIHRLVKRLRSLGLEWISDGTLCHAFRRVAEDLTELDSAFIEKARESNHFEIDASGLPVREQHEEREELESNYWPLWQIRTPTVVIYMLTVRQTTDELLNFFVPVLERMKDVGPAHIMADRAQNIRTLEKLGFMVAFCWAHVRRDYIKLARSDTEYTDFAQEWVNHIRIGFKLDKLRRSAKPGTHKWKKADKRLRNHVQQTREALTEALADPQVMADENKKALLTSLDDHWHGLILFLDHPLLPMHNNNVERGYRWLALFRRVSFACHNEDRAHDRARFYTIYQTLQLHGINPTQYITHYLSERAVHKKKKTEMPIQEWMPWELSDRVKSILGDYGHQR